MSKLKSKIESRSLADFVEHLCLHEEYSDVAFRVEGVRFPAHRLILASREYFRSLLFGHCAKEQQKEIVLKDVKATPFKALLKYVYNDYMCLGDMQLDEVIDIVRLADMYDFKDLTISIEYHLMEVISMENVCNILKVSHELTLDSLCEVCLRFLDLNASQFLIHDHFAALSQDCLCMLLKRDTFAAPEVQIFDAVQDWSKKNRVAKADLRTVMALVRLPLMSVDQLSKIGQSGLVRQDTVFKIIESKSNSAALYTSINVASSEQGAKVIAGYEREELLNANTTTYDNTKGFSYHNVTTNIKKGIAVDLGCTRFLNHIRLLLWAVKNDVAYKYLVEVSTDQLLWERVIDHTQYFCRSWQHLYFPSKEVRYIRFFGTELFRDGDNIFAVVSLQAFQMPVVPYLYNGFVIPADNVATDDHGAVVLTGTNGKGLLHNISHSSLTDSERNEYTSHPLKDGEIVVQLGQPYYIGSIRLLMRNSENRTYRFYVQTSVDKINWVMAVDMRNKYIDPRSESVFKFTQRLVLYVKIIGTKCSLEKDKEFCCARLECPAKPTVSIAIERKCPMLLAEIAAGQP